MERDLLARFTGDSGGQRLQQGQRPLPPPSPALSLRVGSDSEEEPRNRADHGHAPTDADVAAWPCPPAPLASPLVSVVLPGHPAPLPRRPTDLPAGAGALLPPTGGQARARVSSLSVPQRPSSMAMAGVPILQPIGPTAATRQEQCCRDACGLCAQLVRGLAGDLDRARAQVALLTCENESLRHRLKHAAAGVEAETTGPAAAAAALPARLHVAGGLRCRACRDRPATVLLAPREHLCLCAPCVDACRYDPAIACWVCRDAVVLRAGPRHPAAAPR